MSPAYTRQTNLDKRNAKIRQQFRQRYTDQARPRKYTKEYVIAQLAEEHYLSMARVEKILVAKQA